MHDKVKLGHSDDEIDEEDDEEEEEEEEGKDGDKKEDTNSRNNNVQVFADPSTVSMFGSTVSVNIDTSFASEVNAGFETHVGDGDEHSASVSGGGRNKHLLPCKVEPSRLEKALKKVSCQMGNKKSTKKHKDASFEGGKKSKAIKAKMESSKLLFKAMGKGGNSTYKGSKTKRSGGGATVRSKKR